MSDPLKTTLDPFLSAFRDEVAHKLVLSADDLAHLLGGGTLEIGEHRIVIADLGYDRVHAMLNRLQATAPALLNQVRRV